MLVTLVPFFDKYLKVSAYSLFSQKKNLLTNPLAQATGINDDAASIAGMEIIKAVGLDTLSPDAPVFVPVNNIAIFSNISEQCTVDHSRIVLLIDKTFPNTPQYTKRIAELKDEGYKFAIRKLPITQFEEYREIHALMDYVIIDCKKIDVNKVKIYFSKLFPNVKMIVGNLDSSDNFAIYRNDPEFTMFEGTFYRVPVNVGDKGVSPLKTNYLELLNVVNAPDFELTKAADIIGRDTALVVELLKMVNRIAINSEVTSIRHAAAMLGQKELKRWINTVVTKELCSDKPGEITRISLLRAKFAELLAPYFGLTVSAPELFLMGLFSVIDLILDMPMEEALSKIKLSKQVTEALVSRKGDFAEVLAFIEAYENANWQEVSRLMMIKQINNDDVYNAYVESFVWYRKLLNL